MKKIRMGVIGVGGMSRMHIEGIKSSADAELIAICDINEKALNEKSDFYGIDNSHRFTNYKDLRNCPDVDAVTICTSNQTHYCGGVIGVDRSSTSHPTITST